MVKLKVKVLTGKDKVIGLIGKSKPSAVFIKTHFGIHTFGLNFPIDVLILDNNYSVAQIFENMKPNRIFVWNPIFDKVIELPVGEIKKRKIELGTKIKLLPIKNKNKI